MMELQFKNRNSQQKGISYTENGYYSRKRKKEKTKVDGDN